MSIKNGKHLGEDLELVNGARKGDDDAFAALYERHAPIAWRTGLAITGRPEAAGATLAESFGRTFTGIRSDRDPGTVAFRSQLLATVRNTAIDSDRHRLTSTSAAFRYVPEPAVPVAAAFAALPERGRSALWLHEVEGLRYDQIGPVVALSSSATVALTERARNGLAEQYLSIQFADAANRMCSRSLVRMSAYVTGTLLDSDVEKLERHLALCADCTDRHRQLADVVRRLRLLILPLPDDVLDRSRAAWAAAVTAAAGRTGTGLSAATEKVLAGVSAVAAAVGVFGAAMFDTGGGSAGGHIAAAAAAATPGSGSSESTAPAEAPASAASPVELPVADSSGTNRSSTRRGGADTGARSGNSVSSPTPDDTSVIGTSNRDSTATPAPSVQQPTDQRTDEPAPAPADPYAAAPDPAPSDAPAAPAVKVAAKVGDLPVAIEVGEGSGVTVGPLTVGSEPTVGDDEPLISLNGPLAPVAPILDPVDKTVKNLTSTLGF